MPAEPPPARPTTPGRPDRLVLVVGTGTDVGKTWVGAAALRWLRARGHRVAARKPVQSFDPGDLPSVTDAGVLGAATGEVPEAVCPPDRWYPVAMAPPMAAAALGRTPFTVAELVAEVGWPEWGEGSTTDGPRPSVGLVESAGGVRSPLADDGDVVDLARLLRPDLVVLVGDAGLGTINGVRLSAEAMADRAAGAAGAAELVVVLNRFDPDDDLHRRNRCWLAERDGLRVLVTPGEVEGLCQAVLGR